MARVLRSLRSSQPVARFQRYCGLFPAADVGAGDGLAGTGGGGDRLPARDTCPAGSAAKQRLPEANGVKSSAQPQDCAQKYVVKNYFYYYLFKFSSALGEEIFYITFLPFTYWNINHDVSRRLIMMWCEQAGLPDQYTPVAPKLQRKTGRERKRGISVCIVEHGDRRMLGCQRNW